MLFGLHRLGLKSTEAIENWEFHPLLNGLHFRYPQKENNSGLGNVLHCKISSVMYSPILTHISLKSKYKLNIQITYLDVPRTTLTSSLAVPETRGRYKYLRRRWHLSCFPWIGMYLCNYPTFYICHMWVYPIVTHLENQCNEFMCKMFISFCWNVVELLEVLSWILLFLPCL